MRLSVLDQSPIAEGSTGPQALQNTIDLARAADALGYHRFWVAEHHGGTMLAGPSPEALIGPIASATSRIRVGSGGVMLPHYSPLKVAETFSVLSGLFPGRIDLGIGRASGTDPVTAQMLQRDRRQPPLDDFFEQLAELIAYRERFEGSDRLPVARTTVAVWAIAADTAEEAERLAYSSRMAMTLLRRGRLIPVPPVDKAERFLKSEGLLDTPPGRRLVLGAPDTVRAGLEEAAAEYGAEEVIVVSITYDHAARVRSYELIAEAFGLRAAPIAA
jgi:alkanesulfonate monooxygenase SsuD/methylene tetrahydromethanopterin reductase-like flavin-dependent oxidoreductase (luciferase family)